MPTCSTSPSVFRHPVIGKALWRDALALTAVHVNRTLRALEADGLIRRSKRAVMVGNWPRLRAAADFDPQYLHLKEMAEPAELAEDDRLSARA